MATETNKQPWRSVREEMPPPDVELETKIDDAQGVRNKQTLTFHNNLWWFPNMSMYVYYSPTHWRLLV